MKCVPFSALSENRIPLFAEYADRHAVDIGEAAHQRRAVQRLEFVEPRPVDQARDELAHVVGLARTLRDDAVELERIVGGLRRTRPGRTRPQRPHRRRTQARDRAARERERVRVAFRVVVGDPGAAAMHVRAAERLGVHLLAGRRAYQRRPAEEYAALVAHDDGVIGHRGHVSAARRARAVHHRDLRDARAPRAAPD